MIWLLVAAIGLALLAHPFVKEWRKAIPDDLMRAKAPGAFALLTRGRTHYRWFGPEGAPVVVCVHGLTTASRVYEGVADALVADGYRVLVYDHYGRGFSDNAPGLQDADFYVDHLEELLADQGVTEPFTIIGYSMGGAIATCFAARHPEKVKQAFLLATAGIASSRKKILNLIREGGLIGDWLMLRSYPKIHREGTEAERKLPSSVPGIVDYQQAELNRRGFVPAVLSSLRGVLAGPLEREHRQIAAHGIPLTVVFGRDDALIPLSAIDQLADWNPDAQNAVVEGAGHGLPYTHTADVLGVIRANLI